MSLPIKRFQCSSCGQITEAPQGTLKPQLCPRCEAPSTMIHRVNKGPPGGRRGRGGDPSW